MTRINWDLFTGACSINHRQEAPGLVAADKRKQTRRYFILATRDGDTAPWAVEFGDYSRDVVAEERTDWLDHFDDNGKWRLARNARVITCGDTQAEIDAVIRKINAED